MLTKRKLFFLAATACVVLLAAGVAVATTGAERLVVGYNVIMGTHGANDLRGGPGDDLMASEGTWGASPEDTALDTVYGAGGDDLIDTVSDPPSRDVVRCGPGRDEVQADPEDDVGEDCEAVQIIDLTKGEGSPERDAQVHAEFRVVTVSPSGRLSLYTPEYHVESVSLL